MKKFKRIAVIFLGSIVLLITILYLLSINKKNETSINVNNVSDAYCSEKIVYVNDKYYYFDLGEGGILSYSPEEGKRKIMDATNVRALAANQRSLFYVSNGYLYQYFWGDESMKRNSISKYGSQKIDGIYANDQYVFVEKEKEIQVFSAKDICEKIDIMSENYEKDIRDYIIKNDIVEQQVLIRKGDITYLFITKNYCGGKIKDSWEAEMTESYIRIINKEEAEEEVLFTVIDNSVNEKIYGENHYLGIYDNNVVELMSDLRFYDNTMELLENEDIIYEDNGDYSMRCSVINEDKLIVVASNYEGSDFVLNFGTVTEHEGDNLWYVDLKSKSTLRNYCFGKGEIVWYADNEQYILFKEGELVTYDVETQKELCRNNAEWFNKDSNYQYEVILCHDNWFIFNEDTLVDIIPLEKYLN